MAAHLKSRRGSEGCSVFLGSFCFGCSALITGFRLIVFTLRILQTHDVLTRHHHTSDRDIIMQDRLDTLAKDQVTGHAHVIGPPGADIELDGDANIEYGAAHHDL